ncbi:hypothetical protein [Xanthomonas tesorieronis]|uniref:hypothetical protein n=1 Tax=Xanthomonas tesorieronis TaxID=3160839 RepID=UPI003511D116
MNSSSRTSLPITNATPVRAAGFTNPDGKRACALRLLLQGTAHGNANRADPDARPRGSA